MPVPETCTSPPVAVPAAVALPASRRIAEFVVLVVLMDLDSNKLASVTKLTVPPVKAIAWSTVKSLVAPVIVAETLPVPETLLAIVVAAERK